MQSSQHIGIVACSSEGAALCYRTICLEGTELLGPHRHPEVSLHNHSLAEYMDHIYVNRWDGVAELMLSSARKLAAVGADFLICPDNTIHQAFEKVETKSPLPWLHIAAEVAAVAAQRGLKRLGLTGTRYLMEGPVYPTKLKARGIECLTPSLQDRERINSIIMDELVYSRFTPESRNYFGRIIDQFREQGCQGVILGCTEIPLLVSQADSSLPVLDSTRLLARAALRRAVQA